MSAQGKPARADSGGTESVDGAAGLNGIARAADRLALSFSRRRPIVVSAWLCAVVFSMAGYSRQKPLWADEILFRWVATSRTIRDIWRALPLGLNGDPPLTQLVAHGLTSLLGAGPLVLRLPSIAGVTIMLLCLFLTLRIYVGALYAAPCLALPFCTGLAAYGYEARPYGLLYGCLGAAIYCWAKIGDDRQNRAIWNAAFGVALAAALGCHFYSVFALPAFCLGEAVRTRRRRTVSWPTLGALFAASATLVFYFPIMAGMRQYSNAYFGRPHLGSVVDFANVNLNGFGLPLFAFLGLAGALAVFGFPSAPGAGNGPASHFCEITALALGFLLLPLLGWAAGVVVLKAFVDRYVLHGLFGVYLLLPLLAGRIFRFDRVLGLVLALACACQGLVFMARGAEGAFKAPDPLRPATYGGARPVDLTLSDDALTALPGDVVVTDFHVFLQMVDHSPRLKTKCIFLWDPEKERRYTGSDVMSRMSRNGASVGMFRSEPWNGYGNRDKEFLLLAKPSSETEVRGWLRAYLQSSGRYGEVVKQVGQYVVVAIKPARPPDAY